MFEFLTNMGAVAQVTAIGAGTVTIIGFVIRLGSAMKKRLGAQDAAREERLTQMEGRIVGAFNNHEKLDEKRHDDNLQRFDKHGEKMDIIKDDIQDIRLSLARAGLNGHSTHDPH